jgi:hypothetical protein
LNFIPTFYVLQNEQRSQGAIRSEENQMFPMELNLRSNHKFGGV